MNSKRDVSGSAGGGGGGRGGSACVLQRGLKSYRRLLRRLDALFDCHARGVLRLSTSDNTSHFLFLYLLLKHGGNYMYHRLIVIELYTQPSCSVVFPQNTAIFSLHIRLVFIMKTDCVFCEVSI